MNKRKSILLLLSLIALNAQSESICSVDKAIEVAKVAIEKKYSKSTLEGLSFMIYERDKTWAVLVPPKEPGMRGGGTPEASVDKTTCNVINIQLSR